MIGLERVPALDIPSTAVKAKWAVLWIQLSKTTGVGRLIWILIEQVLYTSNQLQIVRELISDLRIHEETSIKVADASFVFSMK